jgi:hypothetical protein
MQLTEQVEKIVENILDEELPEGFKSEKNKLLAKLMQEPSDEAVSSFSSRRQINLIEAKKRLEDNYRKEVEEVEFKEVALRLSNAMKVLAPKMMGLEQREFGREEKAKQALALASSANDKVDKAVQEAKAAVHGAKAEAYNEIIVKLNRELELSGLLKSVIDLEMENAQLTTKMISLELQIKDIQENTLKNKIKKFFNIK